MEGKDKIKLLIEILEIIIVVFALAWFTQAYLLGFAIVRDDGMLPALGSDNRVFVDKCFFNSNRTVQRGDITVIAADDSRDKALKRVVALAGEKVEIRNGFTYVNGEPLYEPYAYTPVTLEFLPVTVPQGHVFVLNDNRVDKNDSRLLGSIPRSRIEGRAFLVYWPWSGIKFL